MSRADVAWLAIVAALLVSDGGLRAPFVSGGAAADARATRLDESQVAAYVGELNPDLTDRQRTRIAAAVIKYSAKYELDASLVLAVIHRESTARPWVRSAKGAVGLMQVMPHMMGVLPVAGNLTSIESNIEAGCIILADNIRRLGEDRGILAYFWGNDIRGGDYLESIEAARAAIRRSTRS